MRRTTPSEYGVRSVRYAAPWPAAPGADCSRCPIVVIAKTSSYTRHRFGKPLFGDIRRNRQARCQRLIFLTERRWRADAVFRDRSTVSGGARGNSRTSPMRFKPTRARVCDGLRAEAAAREIGASNVRSCPEHNLPVLPQRLRRPRWSAMASKSTTYFPRPGGEIGNQFMCRTVKVCTTADVSKPSGSRKPASGV